MAAEEGLVYRLRKRAEIREQISTRKSVQEGKPDRIALLLREAADEIERLEGLVTPRCKARWRAAVLVRPGEKPIPDGARCVLPPHGDDVPHKLEGSND